MEYFKSNEIFNINKKNVENIICNHIFVLAGGQLKNGDVNGWVKERLNYSLYFAKENDESIIYCIGGGTYHKSPILNIYNHVVHESRSCSNYLIKSGFDSKRIKREWASYDTIANGFFSFINFIIPLQLSTFILITSEFHMERAKTIFNFFNKIFNINIKIYYVSSNNNMDNELLKIRINREKKSTKQFIDNVVNKINTVKEFIEWFYIHHNAYNNTKFEHVVLDNKLKDSY
jgi:hypothetical protein